MARVEQIVERVACKDVPVLLIGESGVGKGSVARRLHDLGTHPEAPFIKVNCAALPRGLLESELFGHEKGAFTGAVMRKLGCFDAAAGGTILLDEIGELSHDMQAKLLHVLDDHTFRRVGATRELPLRARVIASTNKALEQAAANGEFREDLYFRLAVVWIEIPPLRKRPEDIVALARLFFRESAARFDAGDEHPPNDLLNAMVRYDWPGNVRELRNFVQRCVLFGDPKQCLAELQRWGGRSGAGPTLPPRGDSTSLLDIGAAAADQAEREAAFSALEATEWNRKAAAKRLNVSYKTLLNKLEKWRRDSEENARSISR